MDAMGIGCLSLSPWNLKKLQTSVTSMMVELSYFHEDISLRFWWKFSLEPTCLL